jgi:hypothetical protein
MYQYLEVWKVYNSDLSWYDSWLYIHVYCTFTFIIQNIDVSGIKHHNPNPFTHQRVERLHHDFVHFFNQFEKIRC